MALLRSAHRGDDGAVVPAAHLPNPSDRPRRGRRCLDGARVGPGLVAVLGWVVVLAVVVVIALTGLFTPDPDQRAYALAVVLAVLDAVGAGLASTGSVPDVGHS